MRINKFIALATGMSRRAADATLQSGRVTISGRPASPGTRVNSTDYVLLDNRPLTLPTERVTILLHKPIGYVVSRDGQGSRTIYDLLPAELHALKPVGRLDKGSSGLLLLTNDGSLANQLTHPRFVKTKVYEVSLAKPLEPLHHQMINDVGIQLNDGPSKLQLEKLHDASHWRITMREGRNRQIRRTFAALGYTVTALHRTHFGNYKLNDIKTGSWQKMLKNEIL